MYKSQLKALFLSIFAFSAQYFSAVTYYVSPNGTGTGTFASPMAFSTAIGRALTAGDSLILRGGIYSFSTKQTISKSGSSTNYLHIVAFNDEIPVLDFRSQAYSSSNPGISLSGSYVHIKGLTIQGAGDNGMIVTGSFNFIENCTFRWNCDSGLQLKTGSNNLVKNCDSYENFDYMTGGTSSPNYGGNADGFADKQYTNAGTNKYIGCRSWLNSDDGWDLYEKIGNTEIDSSWCYLNGPASYDVTDHIRFKIDSAAWFSKFKNTAGRYVIKNYGNGNGFKVGGNYTASNVTLRNCLSANNTVKGFDQNNNNGLMTLFNCTGYNNNADFGFSNSSYGTLLIRNCASLNSRSTNRLSSKTVTQSHNTWNAGFSSTVNDFLSIDHVQILRPRQANGSLPLIDFLHLSPTSNLIDKGTNVGLLFEGSAPDLGAFEFKPYTAVEDVRFKPTIQYTYNTKQKLLTLNCQAEQIQILNIAGIVIEDKKSISNTNNFYTHNWIPGIYILNILSSDGQTLTQKVQIY